MIKATHWVISINDNLTGNIAAFPTFPQAWNYARNRNFKNEVIHLVIGNHEVAKEFCDDHQIQWMNYTHITN